MNIEDGIIIKSRRIKRRGEITMEVLKPIIQTEEPDKYGRVVKVGVTDGSLSSFLPTMSVKEVENLRDELTKIINYTKPQSRDDERF